MVDPNVCGTMTDMADSGNHAPPALLHGTGLVLRDPLPWRDSLHLVETAEDMGYDAVFVPESSFRESFSTLTGFAAATSHIRLGAGVVTMWSRSPATTAMAAATVQDVSTGRFVLGLGAGSPPAGHEPGGSVMERFRGFVEVTRAALSGRPVSRDGRFGTEGFTLGLDVSPVPIWIAALGDRMVGLAGRLGDGVLLNWCTPERVREARRSIGEAASRAGRDPDDVTIAVYVRACLGVDEASALGAIQSVAGQYAMTPHYRRQFEQMGLGALAAAAARAMQAGRPRDVPESLVRSVAVLGGREDALGRFEAYRQAGADLVLCYPVPALDPASSILGTVMAAAPSPAVEH